MISKSVLSCSITSTNFSIPVGVEIRVDNLPALTCDHVNQPIDFVYEVDDNDQEHVWEIELKNKQSEHTIIDSDGSIIQDVLLQIKNMAIDGIELGNLVSQAAEYHHNCNGTADAYVDKFYGHMGCNGVIRLKFTSPVYIWLLENL
jgi:hypothetical protein